MMAQASRDFIYWTCQTVAAQDAIWAVGNPNATDICARCHFPIGWLEGRSDPTNNSLMRGDDYDGVNCDFCHTLYNPFFEDAYAFDQEGGSDWAAYWDEASTLSSDEAALTYAEDATIAQGVLLFNGTPMFGTDNQPVTKALGYDINAGGQYFNSPNSQKRSSFADPNARHQILYSRYHKSKYFCSTCHDISNPILHNLTSGYRDTQPGDGTTILPTESDPSHSYFHVERTFSEFMLSDYALQGGAPGKGPFAPGLFDTSLPGNLIGKCQDCHMRDVVGVGCNKKGAPIRPDQSDEHPNSGLPLHDLTGGNAWVAGILASAIPVSSSNQPASVRNMLVSNFGERFESHMRPRYVKEAERIARLQGLMSKDHLNPLGAFEIYLAWLATVLSHLGNKVDTKASSGRGELVIRSCPWMKESGGNPIFCNLCRAMVMRSFTWTGLAGTTKMSSSIADGSNTCQFNFSSGKDVWARP